MGTVRFQGDVVKATEEQVQLLERNIEARLPEDYRRFLIDTNGGHPSPNEIVVKDCNESAIVDVLLGLGTKNDLSQWLIELSDELPKGLIPIGFDPGGNGFLMDIKKGNCGGIYYWDSARSFQCSTDEENTYRVADSFSEFLGMLKE